MSFVLSTGIMQSSAPASSMPPHYKVQMPTPSPMKVPSIQYLLQQPNEGEGQGAEKGIMKTEVPAVPEDKVSEFNDSGSVSSQSTMFSPCESPPSVIEAHFSPSSLGEKASNENGHNYWATVLDPSSAGSPLSDNLNLIRPPQPHFKPFPCPRCALRFRKRCNLVSHISNVHDKVRPFYCSICLRRFARKSNCSKHVSFFHPITAETRTRCFAT